jgi:hypothetical protein
MRYTIHTFRWRENSVNFENPTLPDLMCGELPALNELAKLCEQGIRKGFRRDIRQLILGGDLLNRHNALGYVFPEMVHLGVDVLRSGAHFGQPDELASPRVITKQFAVDGGLSSLDDNSKSMDLLEEVNYWYNVAKGL